MKKLKKNKKSVRFPVSKIMKTIRSEADSLMILAHFADPKKVEEVKKVAQVYNSLHEKTAKVAKDLADAAGVKVRLKTVIILS
jgi:uncharacterized membrane-anchored protein YhcB (DUF1043 family)